MKEKRLSWVEYGLRIAEVASLRSEDPYRKVGACVLRADNSVASVGYNGAPPGIEIDWSDREERLKRVSHAEIAALRYTTPGEGKYMCVTLQPCPECIKSIAMYGIKTVYYREPYKDSFSEQLAREFGIDLIQVSDTGTA